MSTSRSGVTTRTYLSAASKYNTSATGTMTKAAPWADDTLAEVKVVPVDAGAKPYLDAAESFYGINRVELKTARYQVFKLFNTLKKALPVITDPATQADIQQHLNLMKSDSYLFAGMLRYFDNK